MRTRPLGMLAALAAAALALTGCSVADQSGSASASGSADKGTVTILTHDSFQISDAQIAAFTAQTGYTLQTSSPGDAGVVVNQLILSKDSPTVDGVFGIDTFSAQAALDAGTLAPYTSPVLPESAKQFTVGDALTPIDRGQVCMNLDTAWFAGHGVTEPTELAQLSTPEYAPLVVVTNPAQSSPGLAFLAATQTALGDEGATQFWTDALANGTKVDASWSDAYYTDFSGGEGAGAYPIVLSYSSSPAETAGATTTMTSTCVNQVEYAAVVAGAKNPEGAQAFIDFLLGQDFQQGLPESMYMYPVDSTVALPEQWVSYAKLTETPITVDPAVAGAQRDSWIANWTTLYEANGGR